MQYCRLRHAAKLVCAVLRCVVVRALKIVLACPPEDTETRTWRCPAPNGLEYLQRAASTSSSYVSCSCAHVDLRAAPERHARYDHDELNVTKLTIVYSWTMIVLSSSALRQQQTRIGQHSRFQGHLRAQDAVSPYAHSRSAAVAILGDLHLTHETMPAFDDARKQVNVRLLTPMSRDSDGRRPGSCMWHLAPWPC